MNETELHDHLVSTQGEAWCEQWARLSADFARILFVGENMPVSDLEVVADRLAAVREWAEANR